MVKYLLALLFSVSAFASGGGPIGGGSGAVSSVSNSDSSLTLSPTTGAVVGLLNVGHTNTWTVSQNFNVGLIAPSGAQVNIGATSYPTSAPNAALNVTNYLNSNNTGLVLTNPAATPNVYAFDNSVAGDGLAFEDLTGVGEMVFFNYVHASSFVSLGATGISGQGNDPRYPYSFNVQQSNWNPLTQLVPNAGYFSAAIMCSNNSSTTTNNWCGYGTTGSSYNPMSYWGTRHIVQTSGSEQAEWHLQMVYSGTMTEVERFDQNGQFNQHGQAVTITSGACGATTTYIIASYSNNNVGRITAGTGPSTTCTVNFNASPAWTNLPVCQATDETTGVVIPAVASGNTLVMTGTFATSNVLSYHCSGGY